MTTRDTDWDGVRLHVVTGKGGTGKTTVAAALALALAHGGRKVLLMETEGRQGIARLFDRPPLPYKERKIAIGPGEADDGRDHGGDVYALAVDPEGALLDYLQMFYNMRSAGIALTRLGLVDFATTIAPGLSDVLVTGKATEAARRRRPGPPGGGYLYDAVVMDAPPTGRIGRFLNVTAEVSGLAKVGPVRTHADTVANVIKSPQTAVHFVSTLEEMPVQETLDGIAELRAIPGMQVGGIVINMARPAVLSPGGAEGRARRAGDGGGARGRRAARHRRARRGAGRRARRARAPRRAPGPGAHRARGGRPAGLRAADDHRGRRPVRPAPAGRRAA